MAERTTKTTGDHGEDLAAAFLEAKGLRVMERNYRFNREEVDLVCFQPAERYEDGGELVFVEVKARRGHGFGRPEEAVTEAKQRAVFRVAEAFLHERRLEGSLVRFDVVAITLRDGREPEIEHFENAFGMFGFGALG
ncbi:MAG: YraN family protein [Rhodothermales bacterium]|nr:YraN family protein [Rhodothermales bacterium]